MVTSKLPWSLYLLEAQDSESTYPTDIKQMEGFMVFGNVVTLHLKSD